MTGCDAEIKDIAQGGACQHNSTKGLSSHIESTLQPQVGVRRAEAKCYNSGHKPLVESAHTARV